VTQPEITRSQSTLPTSLTRFIGRQDEVQAISQLILRDDVRLVTLTGPGGIGKTRLSIEVAHRIERETDWDVRFVTLATIGNTEDAVLRIASELGVRNSHYSEIIERLSSLLENQKVLLVVDNLEHVIDVAADISSLLKRTQWLKILGTSRSALHVQGEREYSVPQLTIVNPSAESDISALAGSEAVELFADRARAIHHEFVVDDRNVEDIINICQRLDGLPLAIELAAARTRALPPAALLSRLENQLDILRTDARDVPARLRTIRATIDWSYRLLTEGEQSAMRRLAVFSGDFHLPAASAVLGSDEGTALDTLQSLIEKSLLLTREPFADEPHFRMLSVVRQFGVAQLEQNGELGAAYRAQARWAAEFSESLFSAQLAANQHTVFRRIDRVHDSIRQAIIWTLNEEDWLLAARICANLWQYWDITGHLKVGRGWLRTIINQDIDWPHELIPKLFYGFGILAGSIEDAHENQRVANWLFERYADVNDDRIMATAYNVLALCRDVELAFTSAVKSMELWQRAGETVWSGLAAGLAARWAREAGDLERSDEYSQLSYSVLSEAGHRWGASLALQGVARVHHLRGDIDQAEQLYRQGLHELELIGDRILVLRYFEFLIEIAADRTQWDRAIRLAGAANRMRVLMGYELRYNAEAAVAERIREQGRVELGDELFTRVWQEGERLTLAQSISEALKMPDETSADRPAPTHPESILTRREAEVMALIVAGKTDQAIADELFVSYRTVTTHVTNILNKLGVDSRTEAAAIAVRNRLVPDPPP
jgi:predicted ATPase/DNA-binding CsgD family transcriptional regulator